MKSPRYKRFAADFLTTACLLTLALGSKAEAQITIPFDAPAVYTYVGEGNEDYDVTFDLAPLAAKRAISIDGNGGHLGIAQAVANTNNRQGFRAIATATSPSLDPSPAGGVADVAMDFLASDPLGRARVKVEVEFDAIANAGAPLIGGTSSSTFYVEVGSYGQGGKIIRKLDGTDEFAGMPYVFYPPVLTVFGEHYEASAGDLNRLTISGNGQVIERTIGSGSLLYRRKIVLNVPVGVVQLITIEATAYANAFTFVDPVITPHPDNPEVVVTLRGAVDPNPPPLAILSPEELTAAGIDIMPIRELGLFDPPAPSNQQPVARCQPVTLPATQNSCAVTTASIDNGSSDPDGDTLTLTQSPAGPYPVGITQVALTASDGLLSSQCRATVTVTDTQVPAITCPADQTVTATSTTGAAVNFSPTATDNCSTLMTACSTASGSTFPLGPTAVTCTTTDGAGLQNSCGFNVQVLPTPFATVSAKVELERGPAAIDDELEFKLAFALGAGSNGIAPLTEVVRVQVGPLTFTIPAGSFRVDTRGRYKFAGMLNGARVQASICPLKGGRYEFKLEAKPLNLTTFPSPVATQLAIGNDGGNATVSVAYE